MRVLDWVSVLLGVSEEAAMLVVLFCAVVLVGFLRNEVARWRLRASARRRWRPVVVEDRSLVRRDGESDAEFCEVLDVILTEEEVLSSYE